MRGLTPPYRVSIIPNFPFLFNKNLTILLEFSHPLILQHSLFDIRLGEGQAVARLDISSLTMPISGHRICPPSDASPERDRFSPVRKLSSRELGVILFRKILLLKKGRFWGRITSQFKKTKECWVKARDLFEKREMTHMAKQVQRAIDSAGTAK